MSNMSQICPYTSEQNGKAESRSRRVVDTCLTLLERSGVPKKYWTYSFETPIYLHNRVPSCPLNF